MNVLRFIPWLGSRILTLYLLIFFLLGLLIDYDIIVARALNELQPDSFSILIQLSQNKKDISRSDLDRYIYYYRKIAENLTLRDDAYALLGFCYFHQGKDAKAVEAYTKAAQINPYLFWHNYNLGLIYFKSKKYKEAVTYFKKAKETDLEYNLDYLLSSRIFIPILSESPPTVPQLKMSLQKSYQDCYFLSIMAYDHLENYHQMLYEAGMAIHYVTGEHDVFLFYAGLAAYKAKDYARAIFFLTQSTRLNPKNSQTFFYIAQSAKALGQEEVYKNVLASSQILSSQTSSSLPDEDSFYLKLY